MAASSEDLATVAQVREKLQKKTDATAQDALIQSLITRLSVYVMQYTGCEFVTLFGASNGATPPVYAGSGARTFVYRGGPVFTLPTRADLRSVTSITFDTDGSSPGNTALTADDYRLVIDSADRVWTAAGVETLIYRQVEFRGWEPAAGTSAGRWRPGRQFSINGQWGWPAVPVDVREALIDTVVHALRHRSDFYSAAFNDDLDTGRAEGRHILPFAAKMVLDQYRRRPAG